jgi:hypothetical protein
MERINIYQLRFLSIVRLNERLWKSAVSNYFVIRSAVFHLTSFSESCYSHFANRTFHTGRALFQRTTVLLTMRYTLRRLANNIQEPFRTLSLQTIDDTIRWWQGKSAPKASALRAPWSLSPNLHTTLTKFLHHWPHKMMAYQVPCHKPSFKMVFTKHALVLDQLCNGHCGLVSRSHGHMLLPTLVQIQECFAQSFRLTLGTVRLIAYPTPPWGHGSYC